MKKHSQNSVYRCHSPGTDQREITASQQSSDRPQLLPCGGQQSPRELDRDQGKYPHQRRKAIPVPVTAQTLEFSKLPVPLPSLTWQLVLWSVQQHPTQPFEGFIARKQNECVHQANNLQFTISYQAADVPPSTFTNRHSNTTISWFHCQTTCSIWTVVYGQQKGII